MDCKHFEKLRSLKWTTKWGMYEDGKDIKFELNHTLLREKPVDYIHKHDNIAVCDVLGTYSPLERKITLYDKRIKAMANQLKCKYSALEDIVFAHEVAHALIHLGIRKDSKIRKGPKLLKSLDRINKGIDPYLHEQFAEILAYNGIKASVEFHDNYGKDDRYWNKEPYILEVYNKLETHQPPEYNIDDLKRLDSEKLLKLIELFKFGKLEGTLDNWDIIITFKSST